MIPFSEELISAYLDGELTAEERARVEKQLREDANLRRMCDELRALHFTLQSLPEADPPEDLAARVLRQAERRMLLGEEQVDGEDSAPPPAAAKIAPAGAATPTQRNWRLVAGFVATAAALLVAAFLLVNHGGHAPQARNIARGPEQHAANSHAVDLAETEEEPKPGPAADDYSAAFESAGGRVMNESPPELPSSGYGVAGGAAGTRRDAPKAGPSEEQASSFGRWEGGTAGSGSADKPAPTETGRKSGDASRSSSTKVAPGGRDNLYMENFDAGVGGPALPPDNTSGGGGAERMDRMGGMGGMGMNGRAPAPEKPQSGAAEGSESRMYGTARGARARRGMASGESGLADEDPASRKALAQQLVGQLDRDQLLLVQVSVPAGLQRDFETRFLSPEATRKERSFQLGSALQTMPESERAVELKASPAELLRENLKLKDLRDDNVLLVQGTPDEVRKELVELVSRLDVRVRNVIPTPGLQPADAGSGVDFAKGLKAPATDGVVPSAIHQDRPLAQDKAEDESIQLQRRFSYRAGAAERQDDGGKGLEGVPGRSERYGSGIPEGGEQSTDKSDLKNEMGTRPGADRQRAGYAEQKKSPAAAAPEAAGEKSKVAQLAQQGGDAGGEADKESKESPPQSLAPESGQALGLKPKTADTMEGDQAVVESKPDLAYKRSPETMDSFAVPGKAPQGELVVNILFRYSTAPPAAAEVAEPAGENK